MTANFSRLDLQHRIEDIVVEIAGVQSIIKKLETDLRPLYKRVKDNKDGVANSKASLKAAENEHPRGKDAAKKRAEDIATIKGAIIEREQLLEGLSRTLKDGESELETAREHLEDMTAFQADLAKAVKDLEEDEIRRQWKVRDFMYFLVRIIKLLRKVENHEKNAAKHRAEKEMRRLVRTPMSELTDEEYAKLVAAGFAVPKSVLESTPADDIRLEAIPAEKRIPMVPAVDPILTALAAELGADLADPEQRKLVEELAAERAKQAAEEAEFEKELAAEKARSQRAAAERSIKRHAAKAKSAAA